MNDELRAKLIKDLEQSGFGSEMQTLKTFLDAGWRATVGWPGQLIVPAAKQQEAAPTTR